MMGHLFDDHTCAHVFVGVVKVLVLLLSSDGDFGGEGTRFLGFFAGLVHGAKGCV